ncbi:allantoinase AllB [Edaphobacter aggregans]|uniref:allantoinase AllB n=1 Tax=Edaphobacter aggregans TaxID=570835 RepID=UPI000689C790|nr:allantoinase AllB [Edaphobacter aggregans]
MVKVFISNRVITPQGMRPAAVVVENGRIVAVTERDSAPQSSNVLDFGDLVLMPGLVDTHVHINEPGRTEWEGFETATRAAAAGGITTLVDMPLNCLPETTTVDALEAKRAAAAGKCYVDWAAWGGLTDDNQGHILDLANAGVRGFKCFLIDPGIEGLTMVTEAGLERAAPTLAETGLPLLVHAELPGPIAAPARELNGADWQRYETYLRSRPDAAEIEAIRMLLRLCRKYRFRLHIVHLSTALALEELAAAEAEGLPITVETCPHYLHFAAEEIALSATLLKCAPPIRSAQNREALWNGLQQGTIHLIASDHSPCPPAMKRQEEGDFRKAWGGIASLSIAASIVWTGMRERGISLCRLPQWMAQAPAALAGLSAKKGAIAPGMDADLVVFDPDAKFEVDPSHLHYRHKVSAYLGESFYGVVERTFLRGEEIYNKGDFPALGAGEEQVSLHLRHEHVHGAQSSTW